MKHLLLWKLGIAGAETQTSEAERSCLARHALGKTCLAEIGVWHGVTTSRLRRAMAANGTIFAVDPYPPGRLGFNAQWIIARKELSAIPNGFVVWVRQTGAGAAAELKDNRFDFVFIDGDHSYKGLEADWNGWSPLVTPGGIVALHDSRPTRDRPDETVGSVRFTRDRIQTDKRFRVIDLVDTLTVIEKI